MNQAIDCIGDIEILKSDAPVPYPEAVAWMEARVDAIIAGNARQCLWFLEHPPLFTAGTSAKPEDLLDNMGFPVYQTGRGGQYTYHGPGQQIVYVLLDLSRRPGAKNRDVRAFVQDLEAWIIASLAEIGIESGVREGRVGVWVTHADGSEAKIAAIGIRLRHWVSYHGISINITPELAHFSGIVPCGIQNHGVTSFKALRITKPIKEFHTLMLKKFNALFDQAAE